MKRRMVLTPIGSAPLATTRHELRSSPVELGIRDPVEAQLVGEVRRRRQRPAPAVDRLEPALRAYQEVERRGDVERGGAIERAHPGADQAEVVIERQPAHEHVVGGGLERRDHRAHVGHQVGVAEHHALGIAGRAGGVLDEARRRSVGHRRQGGRLVARQALHGLHRIERIHLPAQQRRQPQALRHRHQDARAGIAQDAGLPAQVVLDLRQPRRRIDRHRHRAGVEDAEKGDEEFQAGRQHQRDPVARHDVALDQAGGDAPPRHGELPVGQRPKGGERVVEQRDMHPVGMVRHMPLQHLHQGAGFARRPADRRLRPDRLGDRHQLWRRIGAAERAEEVAHGLGLADHLGRQVHRECALEAQHQLGTAEAVDAEVAVEPARERNLHRPAAPGAQLAHQVAHDVDEVAFPRLAGIVRRGRRGG